MQSFNTWNATIKNHSNYKTALTHYRYQLEKTSIHICKKNILTMTAILAVVLLTFFFAKTATATTTAPSIINPNKLTHDARNADFLKVLAQLQANPSISKKPKAQSLITDIKHFEKYKKINSQKRQQNYEKTLNEISKDLKQGNIKDALVQAIHAKQLTLSNEKLLSAPVIQQLTFQSSSLAEQAAAKDKWVKALTCYQLLNSLHKTKATYLQDMKNAQHHVQVLKVYVPQKLEAIYKKLADKQNESSKNPSNPTTAQTSKIEQEAKAIHINHQPWRLRLEGINFDMVDQVINGAATMHLAPKGYKPVMLGALGALKIMVNTKQVQSVFPNLQNTTKKNKFISFLSAATKKLQAYDNIDQNKAMEIIAEIRNQNKQTVKLPPNVIAYELAQGATNTLDRFSHVIWPSEVSLFSRTMSGSFSGVGIMVSMRDGKLTVVSPLYNTPAANAGVLAGDVISKVNGKRTMGWSLNHAIRKITGPIGSNVNLTISRHGHKGLIHVILKREKIAIKSVLGWKHSKKNRWDYWIAPKFHIGYVQITQFIPQTPKELDNAIDQMQASGKINGLIVDLRDNPGGLLTSGAGVADRFISHGPIVFTVDARRHHNSVLNAHEADTYKHFPVIVLINGDTASAAEIVSGALQSYARALIVGTRSYGKGSVQDLFPMEHGKAFFKLTMQHYMLPLGQIIHRFPGATKWGIDPDIKVYISPKQRSKALQLRQRADILPGAQIQGAKPLPNPNIILKKGLDPQLETAILVLKIKLLAHNLALGNR